MIEQAKVDTALRRPNLAPLDRALLLARRWRIFESSPPAGAHDPTNGSDRKGEK